MAKISSAVTPIRVLGDPERMTAVTGGDAPDGPSPLTNAEVLKIGTNPPQVNAEARSKAGPLPRRHIGRTPPVSALGPAKGLRPVGARQPGGSSPIFANAVKGICVRPRYIPNVTPIPPAQDRAAGPAPRA